MSENTPTVTIIFPAYSRARLTGRAVQRIPGQGYLDSSASGIFCSGYIAEK